MIKLYIIEGKGKEQAIECEGDTISLGRASNNDVQIEDKSVSREHARIIKKGATFFIEDLNSKNGTFIRGMQVHPGKAFILEEGTPIALGNVMVSLGSLPKEGTSIGKETLEISVELNDNEIAVLDSLDIAKEIKEGEFVEHSFLVRNTGDRPLEIQRVQPG